MITVEMLFDSDVYKGKYPARYLQQAFVSALRRIALLFSRIFLVLDGLDEIAQREELLTALNTFSTSANINLLVVSRLERDIENHFHEIPHLAIPEDMVHDDISSYVTYQFEHDSKLRTLKSSLKDDIKYRLLLQSGGM
jgi:hypothetical protein